MLNVGNPWLAFDFQLVPNDGVGLARLDLEFIISNNVGVQPKVIPDYPNTHADLNKAVDTVARGHPSPEAVHIGTRQGKPDAGLPRRRGLLGLGRS